jgi:hypothetical protein
MEGGAVFIVQIQLLTQCSGQVSISNFDAI